MTAAHHLGPLANPLVGRGILVEEGTRAVAGDTLAAARTRAAGEDSLAAAGEDSLAVAGEGIRIAAVGRDMLAAAGYSVGEQQRMGSLAEERKRAGWAAHKAAEPAQPRPAAGQKRPRPIHGCSALYTEDRNRSTGKSKTMEGHRWLDSRSPGELSCLNA